MQQKQRIEYIDLAKGICILLVVTMHVAPETGNSLPFLSCLRMPLYYCLSGMFFKQYGGFNTFLTKKTDKLLIPFLGWYFIGYIVYYLRVIFLGVPEHAYKLTDLFLEAEFYNGSLWFLLSLFWCNLLFFLITKMTQKIWIQGALTVLFAGIGWIWSYADLHNFLYIGTTLTCLPFFFVGNIMMSKGFISKEKNKTADAGIAAICLIAVSLCVFLPKEPLYMRFYLNYLETGNAGVFYISSLSMVIMALIFCKYTGRLPYVSYLGRYSIIVLVTHGLLHNIINRSVKHLSGMPLDESTFDLILLGVIILLMAVVIPVCKKYLPYITAQKSLIEEKFRKPVLSN